MMTQGKQEGRPGWFATIARPGPHLFATALTFGMIVMGVGLSIAVPDAAPAITVGIAMPALAWWSWMMRASRSS